MKFAPQGAPGLQEQPSPRLSGDPPAVPDRSMRVFGTLLILALGGYLFFNRSFAYLHIPMTTIFVGEIILAVGIVQGLRVTHSLPAILRSSRPLQLLIIFMGLGLAITAPYMPLWGLDAVRDAALWYYGAIAILVALALRRGSLSVTQLTRWYARAIPLFLLWGPVVVAIDRVLSLPDMPGTSTSWLSYKSGDLAVHAATAIAFLWLCRGMTGLSLRSVKVLTGVGLAGLLVAGSVNRGGLVTGALVLAFTVLIAPQRRSALATAAAAVTLAVAFLAVTDVSVELGNRTLSMEQLEYNVESVFADPEERDGTIRWRLEFWEGVGRDVLDGEHGVFGLGFGVNLAELYDMRSHSFGSDQPLRNAHNSHVTLLARMGLPGAFVWLLLWGVWFTAVIGAARRRTLHDGQGALAAWVALAVGGILVNAVFDPTLEGPQVGIWLWTLFGLGCWLALSSRAAPSSATVVAHRNAGPHDAPGGNGGRGVTPPRTVV